MATDSFPDFVGFKTFAGSLGIHLVLTRASVNAWLPGAHPVMLVRRGMTTAERATLAADLVRMAPLRHAA